MAVTVKEKIREVLGITFDANYFEGSCVIDCYGRECNDCPIKKATGKGCCQETIAQWFDSEYVERRDKKKESVKKTDDKTEYEKGFADGQAKVFEDLAKIFERK